MWYVIIKLVTIEKKVFYSPFLRKEVSKTIMKQTRLRRKYLKRIVKFRKHPRIKTINDFFQIELLPFYRSFFTIEDDIKEIIKLIIIKLHGVLIFQ